MDRALNNNTSHHCAVSTLQKRKERVIEILNVKQFNSLILKVQQQMIIIVRTLQKTINKYLKKNRPSTFKNRLCLEMAAIFKFCVII